MSDIIIDCRGLSCPLPVMRVKEGLERDQGPFAIVVDAAICVENISRFLNYKGVPFKVTTKGGESLIEVTL
jgi:TusA-related sulfurtransferase